MLRTHRKAVTTKSKKKVSNDGVLEPDHRLVFAVMAVGMLIGALMTATPTKAAAKLESPMAQHAATSLKLRGQATRQVSLVRR